MFLPQKLFSEQKFEKRRENGWRNTSCDFYQNISTAKWSTTTAKLVRGNADARSFVGFNRKKRVFGVRHAIIMYARAREYAKSIEWRTWESRMERIPYSTTQCAYRIGSGRCILTDHSPQLLRKNAHNGIVRPMSAMISELLVMTIVIHSLSWSLLNTERADNKNNRFEYRNFKFQRRRLCWMQNTRDALVNMRNGKGLEIFALHGNTIKTFLWIQTANCTRLDHKRNYIAIRRFTYFECMPFLLHQVQERDSTCSGKQSQEDNE